MPTPADPVVTAAHEEALNYDHHLMKLAEHWSWDDANLLMKAQPLKRARVLAAESFKDSLYDLGERAGVPYRVVAVLSKPEKLVETPALAAVREFIASDLTFCLLLGGVGSGKTIAACWSFLDRRIYGFLDPVTRQNFPLPTAIRLSAVRFVRASEIARLSAFDDAEEWEELREIPHLVVDDLGVEAPTAYWAERFGELIDVRYGERLATVITSNLSAPEFRAKYGARVASRVNSDGIVANCGARDLRATPPEPPKSS